MSHEFETGFFVKDRAWHGLGTVLPSPPTIGEALELAGLNWSVEGRPLFLQSGEEVETGHRAIVRNSDNRTLGVVGPSYTPVQNAQALAPFQPLVDAGLVDLEAAGSLRNGARVWILGKIRNAEAEVTPGDAVKGYLLFYNGHDGTLSASYQETAIRVVCMNTLSMAVGLGETGKEARLKLRHTAGVGAQIDALTEQCRLLAGKFGDTIQTYRALAADHCPDPGGYFKKVLTLSGSMGKFHPREEPARSGLTGALTLASREPAFDQGKRQLGRLLEIFETQPGADYARGSYWQAYNAVTYWIDHDRGRSDDTRQNASWFGEGRRIRDIALDVARKG
jgi:phage/plasmid-like protein (TIGR03299 family)